MNILLVSCYELGHQPFSLASAAAHLTARGHTVRCQDLAVEELDPERVGEAELVAISIPMHTAIRLGVEAGERIRGVNPGCHLCYFGLYASLNEEYLLETTADSVVGGEFETPLAGRVPEDFVHAWEHPDPRVDRLQEEVASMVQSAAAGNEDPVRTFRRIRSLARSADPGWSGPPDDDGASIASGPSPPRLTEDWFCCAEPTEDQLGAVCG